ncbi:MAG: hypothetical protein CVU04_01840 [Bacteroidetes bacterium HGW-Bacteroidetes-20]|nr:MAG: hypothetical protein CVU04_01840 [Bacteroidetes bacterium HGW-Bacteroidetes-20]
MKKFLPLIMITFVLLNSSFANIKPTAVSEQTISNTLSKIFKKSEISDKMVERGVKQVAQLWRSTDGSNEEFLVFCETYFCKTKEEKVKLFNRLASHFETIIGMNNQMTTQLLRPVHVTGYETLNIDDIFSAYNPMANFNDDMFKNKIAFIVILNFPYFTLQEKILNGHKWTDEEWGFVRLGDFFTSRVEASVNQEINTATANADNYISNYNIPMGKVLGGNFVQHWPSDMKLITHWGLRDELKSNYSNSSVGFEKQTLIYNIMKRIINQNTPIEIFENNTYRWYPPSNGIYLKDIEVIGTPEKNLRYQHLLNIFNLFNLIGADPFLLE